MIGDHPGVTFGIHLCRGNNQSMFYASGGYDPIAAQVFERTRFRSLPARVRRRALRRLRAAGARARRPRRGARPGDDQEAGAGDARTTLKRRIEEASQVVPLERLALSPQCGFASTEAGNRLAPRPTRRPEAATVVAEVAPRRCGRDAPTIPGRDARDARTQVAIVGAGPAGLLLAHLLRLRRASSRSCSSAAPRPTSSSGMRAGVLEQGTVDLLRDAGVGERLDREGLVHHGIVPAVRRASATASRSAS